MPGQWLNPTNVEGHVAFGSDPANVYNFRIGIQGFSDATDYTINVNGNDTRAATPFVDIGHFKNSRMFILYRNELLESGSGKTIKQVFGNTFWKKRAYCYRN